MNKKISGWLVLAGVLTAGQLFAADQIDWSAVPGTRGGNDVSYDFIASPNVFNEILSNNFTAWMPRQYAIDQATTSTGRAQRRAVLGTPREEVASQVVNYNQSSTVVVPGQSGEQSGQSYSEGSSSQ